MARNSWGISSSRSPPVKPAPRDGYVSPGHNSAYYDAGLGQVLHIFHTRFPVRGEEHEIRVHELLFNSQGWPVVAPFRYAPLRLSPTAVVADVTNADDPGEYKIIDHGKDISATIKASQAIRLNADGTISGTVTGTWMHRGNNFIDVTLIGGTSSTVCCRVSGIRNANRFVVTFSAQSADGVSLWGARTGRLNGTNSGVCRSRTPWPGSARIAFRCRPA